MLTSILHRLVAVPWIYDLSQVLAGVRTIHARLAPQLSLIKPGTVVVDVGGGTGTLKRLCPQSASYLCLDIDRQKLRGYLQKQPNGRAVQCDGTRTPLRNESVDAVLVIFVSHHLPESTFPDVLSECARILKDSGVLILLDPLWVPSRLAGRLLWRLDRGAFPRTAAALEEAMATRFAIKIRDRFAVYHEYALYVGLKRPVPRPESGRVSAAVGEPASLPH